MLKLRRLSLHCLLLTAQTKEIFTTLLTWWLLKPRRFSLHCLTDDCSTQRDYHYTACLLTAQIKRLSLHCLPNDCSNQGDFHYTTYLMTAQTKENSGALNKCPLNNWNAQSIRGYPPFINKKINKYCRNIKIKFMPK